MNCEKYIKKCKAACCGIVPLPKKYIGKFVKKQQVNFYEVVSIDDKTAVFLTKDTYCIYLNRQTKQCTIYKDRPEVCRKFGDETHLMLSCQFQKADGSKRKFLDRVELNAKVKERLKHYKILGE